MFFIPCIKPACGDAAGVSIATNTMRITPVATGIGSRPNSLEKFSTTGIRITAIAALFAKLVRINAKVNIIAMNAVSERPPRTGVKV